MARFTPLALVLPVILSACVSPYRSAGPLPPPNPPVYCYETLGRAACYDTPQVGLGEFVNEQVPPPVIVVTQPVVHAGDTVIVTPAAMQPVTPAVIETETRVVPVEGGQTTYRVETIEEPVFTDAPVSLTPYR